MPTGVALEADTLASPRPPSRLGLSPTSSSRPESTARTCPDEARGEASPIGQTETPTSDRSEREELREEVCVEREADCRHLGRVVLRAEGETVAAGLVREILR